MYAAPEQKKILHIVGTRPQYVKLFPVYLNIKSHNNIAQDIFDTGQHYDNHMSKNLIEEFGFENINFGKLDGDTPVTNLALMIAQIEKQIEISKPDYGLIYGDTNSTLAASIAFAKLEVPHGHIEAGVRTEKHLGIQEGINRIVADTLATHNFCPTVKDRDNLLNSTIEDESVILSGDVMFDAFQEARKFQVNSDKSSDYKDAVLVTFHRAENVDNADIRARVCKLLSLISKHKKIILPLHPRLKKNLITSDWDLLKNSNINVIEPLTYVETVNILKDCDFVITDSGGLPKDAAYAGKVSFVLRDEPIWDELYDQGYIYCLGKTSILEEDQAWTYIQSKEKKPQKISFESASSRILETIINFLNG